MRKVLRVTKVLILFFISIVLIAGIKLKLEGKRITPYITKYANINSTNNYGKMFLDIMTDNTFLSDVLSVDSNSYEVFNILSSPKEPLIYIYNTHQSEEYETSSVMDASRYLKEKLLELNVLSIVEERDIISVVNERGLSYPYTYSVSREYALEQLSNNPSIRILIDLHRDSVDKEISTAIINDKSYAKLMFLVGRENERYKENEAHVKILEGYLNDNYPGILRNTYYRDDTYNQQISTYLFSVEVGASFNTFDEVKNTLDAFAKSLAYLLEVSNE